MGMLDYSAAAKRLGVPLGTLYALVCRRLIPHVRLGPRFVRFESAALDQWIAERRIGVTEREQPEKS
jgi:excisionase family DNA binding protein